MAGGFGILGIPGLTLGAVVITPAPAAAPLTYWSIDVRATWWSIEILVSPDVPWKIDQPTTRWS